MSSCTRMDQVNLAPWSEAELSQVSKREILTFLQRNAFRIWLSARGLAGEDTNVLKVTSKAKLQRFLGFPKKSPNYH